MSQAVIYARFSPRRNADNCISNETQIELCTAYCAAKQWPILACFEDAALSGATREGRDGLEAALALSVERKAFLVVQRLDRLARSVYDALNIFKQLNDAKAGLIVIKESFDTTTPLGILTFQMLASIAEYERKMISERTRDGLLAAMRRGKCMTDRSRLPFGFKLDPNDRDKMIRNEDMIAAGRLMEAFRRDGVSMPKIADRLNDMYIPRHSGIPVELYEGCWDRPIWATSSVNRALKMMKKWWPEDDEPSSDS